MRNKILKLFVTYSYVSLVMYVASESALNIAEALCKNDSEVKGTLKFESLWKTTLKRLKKVFKLFLNN